MKIITEDPTCAPWTPINNTLADRQRNGWTDRDPSVPAVTWRPEVRKMFADVGDAFDEAADHTVPLVKMTPNRVMRELYEQFIAYARAYANSVPLYTAKDDFLASVAVSATLAITYICDADQFGTAASRLPLVAPSDPPFTTNPLSNPSRPQQFLTSYNSLCEEWISGVDKFNADIADWSKTDPTLPVAQWTPSLKALTDAARPVLQKYADTMELLGQQSSNSVVQDFSALAAVYLRAYVAALPTYNPNDQYLYGTATQASAIVYGACLAVRM
ncbi:hypothetical protein [Mycobacterium sp. URHB0021]